MVICNSMSPWGFSHPPVFVNVSQLESRGLLFVSSREEILWQRRRLFLVIAPHERRDLDFRNWPSVSLSLSLALLCFPFHMRNVSSKPLLTCMIECREACPHRVVSNVTERLLLVHLLLVAIDDIVPLQQNSVSATTQAWSEHFYALTTVLTSFLSFCGLRS